MMRRRFPITDSYIRNNHRFALKTAGRPTLQRGQMTIVFDCLEDSYPSGLTLEQMVLACKQRKYEETFSNPATDIRKSILYHLNRLESVEQM